MTQLKNTIKLLVAEDDEDDLVLLWGMLSQVRFKGSFHFVRNGRELLDYLRKNKSSPPDVLLLDLDMPERNGIEILAEIRSDPDLAGIPVVIMSGTMPYLDMIKGHHPEVRVDRVVIKPVTVEALTKVLEPLECCVEYV